MSSNFEYYPTSSLHCTVTKMACRRKRESLFHAAPTEKCRHNNWFVVPGDILQINGMRATKPVDGDNNDWLLVGYGDAHGWIKVNRLEPVDEPTE
ncbi:hypothetical protein GY03_00910 [Proteus vulgaris]|nr:hypothetical protein [Proteus vulgaris]